MAYSISPVQADPTIAQVELGMNQVRTVMDVVLAPENGPLLPAMNWRSESPEQ